LIQKNADRLKDVMEKTKLKTLFVQELENLKEKELVICCMDFAFIGGSMGLWRRKKLQEELITPLKQTSFVMISKSEERMMEAAYS
jgi:acetyl-CoA carboxylase carboxyl transferase subunit beta